MKSKQGPPPPLNESLVTRKRKATQVEAPANGDSKKRRVSQHKQQNVQSKGRGSQKPEKGHSVKSAKDNSSAKPLNRRTNANGLDASWSKHSKKNPEELSAPSDEVDEESSLDAEGGEAPEDEFDNDEFEGVSDDEVPDNDEFGGVDSDVVDSDIEVRKGMWSEDEDDDEAEEKLTAANIEGLSRQLDVEQAQEATEAQAELQDAALQTNIAGDRPKIFEDDDEDDGDEEAAKKARLAPDLQLLRTRITETVRVLENFSKLAEDGRSRLDYRTQLLKDICTYYSYSPFLAEKLFNLFSPSEAFAFFEANETPRPVVIRTNTLRTHRRELAQALINRGVNLEPVGKWSKVGLQIFESQVPLGATPEYLAGHYILQAASSFLPVMALAPQENERVLDMTAAPGGKTTHMAALMKNTGCIFANDSNKVRAKGLIGNIHRMGAKNTIVSNCDALDFPKVMGGFDRVLLDAPCSGTGVIAKDPSVKTNKTDKDFLRLPHLQKRLLLAAIDSVNHSSGTGGYIVYSTCSVTVEENEQVVQYALSRRPNVRLVPTGLPFGREGFASHMGKAFHPTMKETRRFYPHAYNVDGFFVAKLKKSGPTVAPAKTAVNGKSEEAELEASIANGAGLVEQEEGGDQDAVVDWNDDEDEVYIERARKARLRRKGRDPRAVPPSRKPRPVVVGHA